MGERSSARQWNDILGIMKQQGVTLDVPYLAQWADVLGVRDLLERNLLRPDSNNRDAARPLLSMVFPHACSADLHSAMSKMSRTFQRAWEKESASFLGG